MLVWAEEGLYDKVVRLGVPKVATSKVYAGGCYFSMQFLRW